MTDMLHHIGRSAKQYTIMHADRCVASIRADGTCSIYDPSFMPFHLYLEKADAGEPETRANNLANFSAWCASRILHPGRQYADVLFASIGAPRAPTERERAGIALACHCAAMTDVYWVKSREEKTTYDDICLFDKPLSGAFVDVSLRGKSLTAESAALINPGSVAADVSTQGMAPKAWVQQDGVFYLLKGSGDNEVNTELLASRIARCFRVDQVLYDPFLYGGQLVSSCRLITSRDYSIVPMEHVEIYAANHDTDIHSLVRRYDLYGYHMMNLIDYLVGNTDRHWGNWGFLVDNRTNTPLRLFPLMDFNRAFQAYDTLEGGRCLTTPRPMSQMDAALEAVRNVGLHPQEEVRQDWFHDPAHWDMFRKRWDVLEAAVPTCTEG
ncbi:MAG: hypothetical protein IJ083_08380 [Clostridia bacterium]|nr:hypothetical protein [Clostridia bacterium]